MPRRPFSAAWLWGNAVHEHADRKAGRSSTANLMVDVVRDGMGGGYFRKDNALEIVFELGALSHGLIMLYLGKTCSEQRIYFNVY